jgi:hypothetical protein
LHGGKVLSRAGVKNMFQADIVRLNMKMTGQHKIKKKNPDFKMKTNYESTFVNKDHLNSYSATATN